ncbi:uncharacterized protein LOC129773556 [Toxorhynchites rutilus septentrionalis]|uniref:uncharacterized protein LOC129773556 n=1 Tax=Toxorhynchites rutilus septentrionalis TaxID=329112 RepID=UPI002478B8AC|nr:uncharacterized protein LOC129773556 [Toxorhynchites rutilus septentrionalis]
MPPTTRSNSLKALQTRLKSLQEMFNDICRFLDTLDEETIATRVTVRLEKLEELWEKVNEAIIDIEMHDDYTAEDDTYSRQRSDFSNRYYEAKSMLLEKVKDLECGSGMNATTQGLDVTQQSTIEHVRLPQIKLQTLDGNIDEWLSFRDLYLLLIHHKTDLLEVEKFNYLKGCLAGEAKALVDPLAITRGNYQVAWETLMKRYNDSKLLIRRQIQALFRMPTLVEESGAELQALLEHFERAIHTLDQLVEPAEYKDLLLLDILGSRLDPATRRGWEEYSASKDQDTIKDMVDFLQRRIRVLDSLPPKGTGARVEVAQPPRRRQPLALTNYNAVQTAGLRCVACSDMHLLYKCPQFRRMTISTRDRLLRSHSLCRNCFKRGHQAVDCLSRFVCRVCKGKHHTLVCFREENSQGNNAAEGSPVKSRESSRSSSPKEVSAVLAASTSNTASYCASSVLLATAIVLLEDDNGTVVPARALLDSGSECNFMTEGLNQRLKCKRRQADVAVSGIGQETTRVKHTVSATVRSRFGNYTCKMDFILLPRVTANLPTKNVVLMTWKIPKVLDLADPAFTESKSVDIILGIQHFFTFFKNGNEIHLGAELPSLTRSVFGWVVTETVGKQNASPRITCNSATSIDLDALMNRFWACEEVEKSTNYSPEEQRCEDLYKKSVKRERNGRYTVSLPKIEDVLERMGESRDIAFRRLQALERRLQNDPAMRLQYNDFMQEYLRLGHMRKVDMDNVDKVKRYFLPHHPVIKATSTTTKLRVVFDASCKTGTGISLNDSLMVGPVIQEDLRNLIIRCRTRQIMLVADVEKMFRQINMNTTDVPLQSILWRTDPSQEVDVYELTTVTYGTKPAPFLATRTLKQLAENERSEFSLAADSLIQDVYMDDIIAGVDNVNMGSELRNQLDSLLQKGGFRLRKWASNCPQVLEGVPPENLALSTTEVQLDPDPAVRTLGLIWIPGLEFQFKIPPVDIREELN